MYVLTFSNDGNTGVYCLTDDRATADAWADLGDGFNVTEIEPEDFTSYNTVMDELEDASGD